MAKTSNETIQFSSYQKLTIFILAVAQFSVLLDFMVIAPLGDLLIKSLSLKPAQFGIAVSAYAFSAGISGLLIAGFADRYDRKKLLLFFYAGFIVGTLCCAIAPSYIYLVAARIVTGLFGGVISSMAMAIIADIFPLQQRGRVMGYLQLGFSASQVLGIPVSLLIANLWGWQYPFVLVSAIGLIVLIMIAVKLQPLQQHLQIQQTRSPLLHLRHALSIGRYHIGYIATALMSIGGFMMMPFSSSFAVNNLHIIQNQLPVLFMASGITTLVVMPLIGKLSDKMDKFKLFTFASILMMTIVVIYTNLGPTPFWIVVALNMLMMSSIMSRMIPSSALTSAIPEAQDRGAYMSITASLQQIAGGIAAAVAGIIVTQKDKLQPLEHYNIVGYMMVVITLFCIYLVYRINKMIIEKNTNTQKVNKPSVHPA